MQLMNRFCNLFSNAMPHRVQAIFTADGWYTKYQEYSFNIRVSKAASKY
jgi:hypothetical protein